MEPISATASAILLSDQALKIVRAASRLKASSIHRGLLDRLWLCQKIISRSADVLPQALRDSRDHQESIELCLAQCARLLPKLQEHVHKVKKSALRSFLPDQNILGALEELETWTKLLSEEINQWKITQLHEMAWRQRDSFEEFLESWKRDKSRIPKHMVEGLLSRFPQNYIPRDMITILLSFDSYDPERGIPKHLFEDLLLGDHSPEVGIPRKCVEDLISPHAQFERHTQHYGPFPFEGDAAISHCREEDETQRPFLSTNRDDHNPATEAQETAGTTAAHISARPTSRVGRALEQASERLHELSTLGTERPFLFPFVIVPDDPQAPVSTPFRVKLDSGCDLNWISTRIVKRAGLEDKQDEAKCDRAWQGFSGGEELIVPQASITLTWYSVNAAYTHRHEFLVHDQVPFDVVLGSEFIIEEGWKKSFNDPVLALRYSELSDEQLREIHHKARQDKEEIDVQRQAEREMRARDRQARRQFGLSRTGTPRSFLSPAGSQAISRRMSMATLGGRSSLARSPLSAQQSHSATSENSISESPGPLSTTSTQQDAAPSNLEETIPSVQIETEPERDGVDEAQR